MIDLLNKRVQHKGSFGTGIIVKQDDEYISIEFESKTIEFKYPDAFEKYLEFSNPTDQTAVEDMLLKQKEKNENIKEVHDEKTEADTKLRRNVNRLDDNKNSLGNYSSDILDLNFQEGHTYIVFQGSTFDVESRGQYIWAPKYNKKGHTRHYWDLLENIESGDIIFHCSKGEIRAISIAQSSSVDYQKPEAYSFESEDWEQAGRKVNCQYYVLRKPIEHGRYKDEIVKYTNVKYAPFDKYGNGNMGYLYKLDKDLAKFFLREILKVNF